MPSFSLFTTNDKTTSESTNRGLRRVILHMDIFGKPPPLYMYGDPQPRVVIFQDSCIIPKECFSGETKQYKTESQLISANGGSCSIYSMQRKRHFLFQKCNYNQHLNEDFEKNCQSSSTTIFDIGMKYFPSKEQ